MGLLLRSYSHLSLGTVQRIGNLLGKVAWHFKTRERHIAETNLSFCFPDYTDEQCLALAKQSLCESAKLIAELPLAWLRPVSYWHDKIDDNGLYVQLDKLKQSGRGVICVAPHLGNWEIGLNALTASITTTVLFRPPRQQWVSGMMTTGRQATGANTAPTDASGIRLLLAALKKGEAVAILPDQTPKRDSDSAAIFAPFFGRPAYTMTLVSKLAAKTNAAVLAAYAERLPAGKGFRIHYHVVDGDIYSKDIDVSVKALNQAVEKCVRELPEQYQWSYKRFTIMPEGITSLY